MENFVDYDVRMHSEPKVNPRNQRQDGGLINNGQQPLKPTTRTIEVGFRFIKLTRRYAIDPEDNSIHVVETRSPTPETFQVKVSFVGSLLIDEESAIQCELRRLTLLGIPTSTREMIVRDLGSAMREMVQSCGDHPGAGSGFGIVVSIAEIKWERMEDSDEFLEQVRRAEMESMDAEAKPTPATVSSIQALERRSMVVVQNLSDCAICMEEIEMGKEAIRMPCSHLYHQDCIVKWLQNSHFCPLCRYSMPVDEEEEQQ